MAPARSQIDSRQQAPADLQAAPDGISDRLVIGQMGTPMVVLTMASVPGEKR